MNMIETYIQNYGKETVAITVPFITWGLNSFLKPKAKLQISKTHEFSYILPFSNNNTGTPQLDTTVAVLSTLHTRTVSIKNTGKDTATKIELVFNYKPACFNIVPVRHYTEYEEPNNRYVLIFDSLAPKEIINCALIGTLINGANSGVPDLINLRSDQCGYEDVPMILQPIISNNAKIFYSLLQLLGMGTAIYFSLLFLQLLIS